MPRVRNKRDVHAIPPGTPWTYVGRPSKWGNPYTIGMDGTRAEVIIKYREWLKGQPVLMGQLHELRGRDLVCWCAPQPCHGDILLELANA